MITPSRVAAFWSRVRVALGSCWTWTGGKRSLGYGYFWNGERVVAAHRFAYEGEYGLIPPGLQIDHLCRTPECVNPLHLEAVTGLENVRRGIRASRTRCPCGAPLNSNDLRYDERGRSSRICRSCKGRYSRESWQRRKDIGNAKARARRAAKPTHRHRPVKIGSSREQCSICNLSRAYSWHYRGPWEGPTP